MGALGNGERGVHIALEMLLWTRHVTLFTDGEPLRASALERELLRRHGVRVIETPLARAYGAHDGELRGVVLSNGACVPLAALFFNTGRCQTSDLPDKLGLRTTNMRRPGKHNARERGRPARIVRRWQLRQRAPQAGCHCR